MSQTVVATTGVVLLALVPSGTHLKVIVIKPPVESSPPVYPVDGERTPELKEQLPRLFIHVEMVFLYLPQSVWRFWMFWTRDVNNTADSELLETSHK